MKCLGPLDPAGAAAAAAAAGRRRREGPARRAARAWHWGAPARAPRATPLLPRPARPCPADRAGPGEGRAPGPGRGRAAGLETPPGRPPCSKLRRIPSPDLRRAPWESRGCRSRGRTSGHKRGLEEVGGPQPGAWGQSVPPGPQAPLWSVLGAPAARAWGSLRVSLGSHPSHLGCCVGDGLALVWPHLREKVGGCRCRRT